MPLQLSQVFANLFAKKTTAEHTHNAMTNSGDPRQSLLNNGHSRSNKYLYGSTADESTNKDQCDQTKVDFVTLAEKTTYGNRR